MSTYVFHRYDATGEIAETFLAELAPAQLDRILHPYQTVIRAGVRLVNEINATPTEHITGNIIERANAFNALLGEYTDHDD